MPINSLFVYPPCIQQCPEHFPHIHSFGHSALDSLTPHSSNSQISPRQKLKWTVCILLQHPILSGMRSHTLTLVHSYNSNVHLAKMLQGLLAVSCTWPRIEYWSNHAGNQLQRLPMDVLTSKLMKIFEVDTSIFVTI